MPYKVSVDKEACIGCGACTAVCDNFKMVDNKSQPIKEVVGKIGCNKDAEETCPVKAISVEEVK